MLFIGDGSWYGNFDEGNNFLTTTCFVHEDMNIMKMCFIHVHTSCLLSMGRNPSKNKIDVST